MADLAGESTVADVLAAAGRLYPGSAVARRAVHWTLYRMVRLGGLAVVTPGGPRRSAVYR